MCGFTGWVDRQRATPAEVLQARVVTMANTLVHRGPDDSGSWVEPTVGLALGHRRLSILDLSPTGHQPMSSADGQWIMAYNGEVYNHAELRQELTARGVSFRGTSDTETLVNAFAAWGVGPTLARCRGIFALAAYDRSHRRLTLARDHLGVKPLYYGRTATTWLFGSELKAMRAHPSFTAEIDRDVLPHYLRHNYVPGPYTIYRGCYKLPPGTTLTIDLERPDEALPQPEPYWSFTAAAERGVTNPFTGSFENMVETIGAELARSVREQMLADVPLGAFLSGGIDSSLVVALMQQASSRPVRTFTIGFESAEYDESPYAAVVAKHLGTEHTVQIVTAAEARDVIPQLPKLFDEPFADSSQIPTFLVSRLARQHVTVSLSGDGGDELFCGYLRYFAPLLGIRGGAVPRILREPMQAGMFLAARWLPSPRARKFCRRAASFLADADPDDRYLRGMSHWALDDRIVPGSQPLMTDFLDRTSWPAWNEHQRRWMWLDTRNYLPDDILVKVDRASMGVSLEARVPLLDPRVVEAAWRIPLAMQTQRWSGKQVLKSLLARYVPRELFERPKRGFGVPIADWLRGPLRDWAEAALDESRLVREGYFDPQPIRARWAEHLSGKTDWAYHLWDVLMFQCWLEA